MFRGQLEQDLGRINKLYQISELENIMKIVNNEFLSLQKKQIDLIINLKDNQSQKDFTWSQDLINKVIIQVQQLQLLITVDNTQNRSEQQQFQQEQIIQQEIDQIELVPKEQKSSKQEEEQVQKQQLSMGILNQQVQQLEQQQISQAKDESGWIQQKNIQVSNNQMMYSDYFDFKSKRPIFILASQISEDEKYLAIGDSFFFLHIYDMNTKKQIKQLDQNVSNIRFTDDSRYLVSGGGYGHLYCHDIGNNFSQIYNKKIHRDRIRDILVINNNQIITCDDYSIIITNMPYLQNNLQYIEEQNDQALLINHIGDFTRIDFDYKKDCIICCSGRYISFFMRQNGQEIFEYNVPSQKYINQIQMIPNNKIISSDRTSLILWQIDYDQKLLIQIRKFNQTEYYNFTFIDNSKIIIVCNREVFICDDDLNQLYSQDDIFKWQQVYFATRQIKSANYIIIQNNDQIKVLKRN
ncbi:hypothetical protein pb186bvf_018518 [Paramecium bursaria]